MAAAQLQYFIFPVNPQAHLFEIELRIQHPDQAGQILDMPAWIPGSYMIRDFAKHVVELRAECGGYAVKIWKRDKQTWQCAPCEGPLHISYQVYAWDMSVRAAHVDTTHAYFNGTSVFLRVKGQEANPCLVEIKPPIGEGYKLWRLATSMPSHTAKDFEFGVYRARDYDELVDHPVEMGEFAHVRFAACGVPHDVVVTGRHYADLNRLAADLTKICEAQIKFFTEPAPMERYVFLVMVVGNGYGGLEHRASTSLLCSRDVLPIPGQNQNNNGYRDFLALCSHEYFHTWNVKRIKPQLFAPYNLNQEVYTELLWVFEGITSYYDELFLVRTGLLTDKEYLEMLGEGLTRVYRGSGRFKQSIAESSFDTWTKFYKQDENAPNSIVSYYTKGALVAMALDLKLRIDTDGRVSLDDVMRESWQRWGKTEIGMEEHAFEAMVEEVSGLDLKAFFELAVRGYEDLPLVELMEAFAVEFRLRPAQSQDDKGGKAPPPGAAVSKAAIGGRVVPGEGGAKLQFVYEAGTAMQAGLSADDVIIAVDGIRVGADSLAKTLGRYQPGERVRFTVFRRDELMEFVGELIPNPENTVYLSMADSDEACIRRRQAWLSTATI